MQEARGAAKGTPMTPIPAAAMPVVEILRRDVKRPKRLPKLDDGDMLCWKIKHKGQWGWYCPMGLHPKSDNSTPAFGESFAGGETKTTAVKSFAKWWDELYLLDAAEAVAAIWPEVKG